MPFTLTLPQTAYEALLVLVPFVTALLGFAYLVAPKTMLKNTGLEAQPHKPEAIGEGRATFAGILLAFGICCLALQEPRALQPGLNTMLSIAWLISGLAFLFHLAIERQKRISDFARIIVAFTFFSLLWATSDEVIFGFNMPRYEQEWIFAAIAAFTIILGLIALFMPKLALKIMRLQESAERSVCICGPRGLLGGFYIAAGLGLLIITEPVVAAIWLQMLLGAVWLFTGIGRIVAMILDPKVFAGFTIYNIVGTIFELSLGFYVLGSVLGVI